MPLRTLLLATDASADAALARRAAVDLARASGAALHLATAWDPLRYAGSYSGVVLPVEVVEICEREGRETLRAESAAVEAAGVAVAGDHLLGGPAAGEVAALASRLHADLIIVGSRGLGPIGRLILGSVSESLVHETRCPVLVVRGGEGAWPPRRVVAGFEAADKSRHTAEIAAAVATALGVSLTLVHAIPRVVVEGVLVPRHPGPDVLNRAAAEVEHEAATLGQRTGAKAHGSAVVGHPAEQLLEAASERDARVVTVVGRGERRGHAALLGTNAAKILHASIGPVMIVPHPRLEADDQVL